MINKILALFNYQLVPIAKNKELPPDFTPLHHEIFDKVKNLTMTSPERIMTLIDAVQYIHKNNIEGSIVECGVWKGGSMIAAISTLQHTNDLTRSIYLYDTFDGMSEPTTHDVTASNKESAQILLASHNKTDSDVIWAYAPLNAVRKVIYETGYPEHQIHFVIGKVEETLPITIPAKIALLRLDTDWYESTLCELKYLFPLLSEGGILIIDDYGHWEGARKAVDEYFVENKMSVFLHRIDYTGRLIIKKTV